MMGFAPRRKGAKLFALSALVLLAGCGSSGGPTPEFIKMPGLDNYAMIIPEGLPPEQWKAAAKEKCGAATMCSVFAWTRREDAARAIPMTDSELESQAFNYQFNRDSGFDEALWDCRRFKRPNPDQCLAIPDPAPPK